MVNPIRQFTIDTGLPNDLGIISVIAFQWIADKSHYTKYKAMNPLNHFHTEIKPYVFKNSKSKLFAT